MKLNLSDLEALCRVAPFEYRVSMQPKYLLALIRIAKAAKASERWYHAEVRDYANSPFDDLKEALEVVE